MTEPEKTSKSVRDDEAFRAALNAYHLPDDAGELAEPIRQILSRIPDGWGRWLSFGPGWYKLVCDLDRDLSQLDPDYVVHQAKEKFGSLRYYIRASVKDEGTVEAMYRLVAAAEEASGQTCELTGEPGVLCGVNWYQTLDPTTHPTPVVNDRDAGIPPHVTWEIDRGRMTAEAALSNAEALIAHYAKVLSRFGVTGPDAQAEAEAEAAGMELLQLRYQHAHALLDAIAAQQLQLFPR